MWVVVWSGRRYNSNVKVPRLSFTWTWTFTRTLSTLDWELVHWQDAKRVYLHQPRPGWLPDWVLLLGALWPGARDITWWKDYQGGFRVKVLNHRVLKSKVQLVYIWSMLKKNFTLNTGTASTRTLTTPPSTPTLATASMCRDLSSLTWSQPSLTRFVVQCLLSTILCSITKHTWSPHAL